MSERMRIAFVIPSMQPGGTERQLLLLMRGLAEDCEMMLVCTREAGELYEEASRLACFAEVLNYSSGWTPCIRSDLKRIFTQQRPDIVHAFLFGFDYWAARAAQECGVPVVITARRELAEWQQHRHLQLVRRANAITDLAIANSGAVADFAADREWADPSFYRVIYNGLPDEAFMQHDRREARARFKLPQDVPVVGMAANFSPIKDHGMFMGAAQDLQGSMPGVHFFLLGRGEKKEEFQHLFNHNVGADSVTFAHTLDEMPLAYAAMDVCVLTSKMEGAPNVLLEAQAAGRPVVASRVGGVPEMVVDGEAGYLITERNRTFFAEAVASLLADAGLRARMGEAGRARMMREFRAERMVEEHLKIYRELLAAKRG